jgi:hypothetical protein
VQDVFMEKYITALMEALHPFGDVLEVGFGAASKEIEKYQPQSHTIIVPDGQEALQWAKNHPSVRVIEDVWQSALPQLGVFDAIFFGVDPQASPLFERMAQIRYTDHNLALFCQEVAGADKKHISRFLAELEQNGQISAEQREAVVKKYHLTHEKPPAAKRSNEMLLFLKACLSSHMRKGSRYSCFLKSELDDSQFFNEIVVDPTLDYRENGRIIVIEKLA